jgi:hypothetical protein
MPRRIVGPLPIRESVILSEAKDPRSCILGPFGSDELLGFFAALRMTALVEVA